MAASQSPAANTTGALFLQFGGDPDSAFSRRLHLSLLEPWLFLEGAMERREGGGEVPVRALVLEKGEVSEGRGRAPIQTLFRWLFFYKPGEWGS